VVFGPATGRKALSRWPSFSVGGVPNVLVPRCLWVVLAVYKMPGPSEAGGFQCPATSRYRGTGQADRKRGTLRQVDTPSFLEVGVCFDSSSSLLPL
jgi:hypothetical protein